MSRGSSLATEIVPRLRTLGVEPGAPVLVALSGGLDSVTLLHLLRFATDHPVSAAHLDHGMRRGSSADARWVRGVCAAWGVPLQQERADPPPTTEDGARRVRYAFLRDAARRCGAHAITTAHHADDQAETVLFRAARGSGIRGLRGIRERDGALVRPLLPWPRAALLRYARRAGLRWREDASNRTLGPRRNRLRHTLLPLLEAEVAPGAARNLARLAELAGEREAAVAALLAPWAERALAAPPAHLPRGELLLRRPPFAELPRAAAAELLRALVEQGGWRLGAAGTRSAVTFITDAPPGRALRPGGGIELLSESDGVRVRALATGPDRPLLIAQEAGEGEACLGGRTLRVRWGGEGEGERVALPPDSLPALLRAWAPGDALRCGGRRISLRDHFRRTRVPRAERARTPVLEDASGELRWCRGVGAADDPPETHRVLYLNVRDD